VGLSFGFARYQIANTTMQLIDMAFAYTAHM